MYWNFNNETIRVSRLEELAIQYHLLCTCTLENMLSNTVLILGCLFPVIAILLSYGDYVDFRALTLTWLPFLSSSVDSAFTGKLFTKSELSKLTGKDGSSVYLSILGDVFDVSKGRKHYGEGGGYEFFSGDL